MVDKRAEFLHRIFSEVPSTYELVNHILTFGLDIIWRRRVAGIASVGNGSRWADMCSGTGETAAYLSHLAPMGTTVYAIDFSLPMLGEAKRKPEAGNIKFVSSDIKALPFPDNSFDMITISFAKRNINLSKEILVKTLAEIHRVLKPEGRFINLETSRPSFTPVRRISTFISSFL